MKRAIREHATEFVAIVVVIVLGLVTTVIILANQQAPYPAWVPFLGEETFELKADLETAQAVTPGQGQTVNVAGIKVGDITEVDLEDGHAVVTMLVEDRYRGLIRDDATVLLRPRTGLQDMTLEVDPGVAETPMEEGGEIPLASTQPNINFDEFLKALDGDTQDYLTLLTQAGAEGLSDGEGASALLRRFSPLARYLARLNGGLAERQDAIRRAVSAFKDVNEELGAQDTRLADFVASSEQVLSAFARQEASLRATFQELPGALTETRGALESGDRLALELGPAARDLIPAAQALKPALEETEPFFRKTVRPIREQITPFARQVQAPFAALRRTSGELNTTTPVLTKTLGEVNNLFNAVGYNPPGPEEGYLFWASWLGHDTNQLFTIQDANGPVRRALVMQSCQTAKLAEGTALGFPFLQTIIEATRIPRAIDICPAP